MTSSKVIVITRWRLVTIKITIVRVLVGVVSIIIWGIRVRIVIVCGCRAWCEFKVGLVWSVCKSIYFNKNSISWHAIGIRFNSHISLTVVAIFTGLRSGCWGIIVFLQSLASFLSRSI